MEGRTHDILAALLRFLDGSPEPRPTVAELAAEAGMSRFHFQRVFRDWVGISPGRFLQWIALRDARDLLDRGRSVLDASLDLGLSGPGRLHDLFVHLEALSPGEYRRRAQGERVDWGRHLSPLGPILIACTQRGICHLEFMDQRQSSAALARSRPAQRLSELWPGAQLVHSPALTAPVAAAVFERQRDALPVHLKGTNFQLQVWSALLHLPAGAATSYGQLAAALGRPNAARAVGNAVGHNPVAVLVPCHRVLRSTGAFGGYRWGPARKRALLARDRAMAEGPRPQGAPRASSKAPLARP